MAHSEGTPMLAMTFSMWTSMLLKSVSVLSESYVYFFLINWNLVDHGVLSNSVILLIQHSTDERSDMVKQGRGPEEIQRR